MRKKNSIILIWVTGPFLFHAYHIMNLLGYKYVNVLLVWRKLKKDGTTQGRTMGFWTRTSCEYLLFGVIGRVA